MGWYRSGDVICAVPIIWGDEQRTQRYCARADPSTPTLARIGWGIVWGWLRKMRRR
jgi:hypothetical protein